MLSLTKVDRRFHDDGQGDSMVDTPRLLGRRFPVWDHRAFLPSALKESRLETFAHRIYFKGDRIGIVNEPIQNILARVGSPMHSCQRSMGIGW